MQQLKDMIGLVPFSDWPQHSGQPIAQRSEPPKLVEPGRELAMPIGQRGSRGRGADGRLGLLADCCRIVGLAAACSHQVPP
jgi:hypothetical protein